MLRTAGVLAIACAADTARADSSVTVTLNQTGRDLADQIGASVTDLIANAQTKIDALFELEGLPHLLHSFANTATVANLGVGVDYQVDAGDLMIGIVADSAIAADAKLTSSDDHVLSATVVNYGITAGVNLGRWNQPRWTVMANGSYASTTIHGLKGDLRTGGLHAQYKVVPEVRRGAVTWTGVDATSGLELAHWQIGLASRLSTDITVTGTKDHAGVHMDSAGTLTVLAKTYSIPLEVTTGVRLFRVLGLYAGGGLSLTTGSSTVTANLDSELQINADHTPIGNAIITASDSDGPSSVIPHGIAGIEVHTRHVRVFAQGLIAPDERALAIGVRGGD